MTIGIISDTHGLLRPEAIAALEGVDAIIHAGDVGKGPILERLEEIASVHAVRGNVDHDGRAGQLPEFLRIKVAGKVIFITHILKNIDFLPDEAGVDLLVYGHSHKPESYEKNGVLYLNPGSAGRKRFNLPITLALVRVRDEALSIEFVELIG